MRLLCALSDVPTGAALRVELDDLDVAVVRVGGEVYAVEDICSHAAVPLSYGEVCGHTIECELHGSRFDLRTGEPTGPPAVVPITVLPVYVTDDNVYVES